MPPCVCVLTVRHRRDPRFLGTESFPEEGAFKAFLQKHGGSSNAFTGMETTGFHFVLQESALTLTRTRTRTRTRTLTTGFHFVLQESALRPALKHFSSFFTVSTK